MIERIKHALFGVHMNSVTHGKVAEILLEDGVDIRELRPGEIILICNKSREWGGECTSTTPPRFRIVYNDRGHLFLMVPVYDMIDKTSSTLKISLFLRDHVPCHPVVGAVLTNAVAKQEQRRAT